ncbi:MAG: response regulator [Spirochaetes bacterium]|nr:response regulator [Spirochaetota bacterium]
MKRALSVLIVEDEALTVLMLRQFLSEEGHRSVAVASGQAALEATLREVPDLILMDVGLPGPLDGVETSRRILSQRRIPLILISGFARDELLERIRPLPILDCLTKPLSLEALEKHLMDLSGKT